MDSTRNFQLQNHIIELWKFRELIRNLELFTSETKRMVSLFISPTANLALIGNLLNNTKKRAEIEYSPECIDAINAIQSKLELYRRIPDNGLIFFCGTVQVKDSNEVTVNIDFEPFKLIYHTSISINDVFDTDSLVDLIVYEDSKHFFDLRLNREKNILDSFYRFVIDNGENRLQHGASQTIKSLCEYMVDTIIVIEDLDLYKVSFINNTNKSKIKTFYVPEKRIEKLVTNLKKESYELCEQVLLLEWLVDNYRHYGSELEIISVENNDTKYFSERYEKIACTLRMPSVDMRSNDIGDATYDDIFVAN